MKCTVNPWNNFCRVFELPKEYPTGFCFNGGYPGEMLMVDWFNPVGEVPQAAVTKEVWQEKVGDPAEQDLEVDIDELGEKLLPFMKAKQYIQPGRTYLIIFDFGGSLIFEK